MALDTVQKMYTSSKTRYTSVTLPTTEKLTLCDPITQICKRIKAFFRKDPDVKCVYNVNNSKSLGPKIDPDTGEPYTKMINIDGESVSAIVDEDHICELRLIVDNYEKAQCLSNVVRHRHLIPEPYQDTEGAYHIRSHWLLVRVFSVDAIDPQSAAGGDDPWISDDDTASGLTEIFGLEPIDWEDPEGSGCNERLAPSDLTDQDIPHGVPEEYEQQQWEQTPSACTWKWKWLKTALHGNKNIININYEWNDGMNTWRFIECGYMPVVFSEDSLTSVHGFTSILPADLMPLIFTLAGKFQISTYARAES